jgi:hypothetical protein
VKLAYLITAYDQPAQLDRLVNVLDGEDVDFYIHVDRNVDIAPFERPHGSRKNVHFLRDRVRVRWMGYSQVESILRLMAKAAENGFDFCTLLSGSDYPIKSNREIENFFRRTDKELMTFWRLQDKPSWLHKIEYYYPIDLVPIHGYHKECETVSWRRWFWRLHFRYQPSMAKRTFIKGMVPYGGSDWYSLSYQCVSHVLNFVAENPAFVRFFKCTHCPSELFFHTIILNSDLRHRVMNLEEYEQWSSSTSDSDKLREDKCLPEDSFNLRYIDWSGDVTKAREAPAILDTRDWEMIRSSQDLFARKMHPVVSRDLLELIDTHILGVETTIRDA